MWSSEKCPICGKLVSDMIRHIKRAHKDYVEKYKESYLEVLKVYESGKKKYRCKKCGEEFIAYDGSYHIIRHILEEFEEEFYWRVKAKLWGIDLE